MPNYVWERTWQLVFSKDLASKLVIMAVLLISKHSVICVIEIICN